jgi:phosphohistidine phosphatase
MARSVYLVRHAIAGERGPEYPDDAQRPVTKKGAARMRQGVRGLRSLAPGIELVLTSPLVRARDTAGLLAAGLAPEPDVLVLDALAPGCAPADVVRGLTRRPERGTVALVGHEPDLGLLAAWLLGAREPLVFKKGGIARIDFDGNPGEAAGRLIWLATPRMLRGLA